MISLTSIPWVPLGLCLHLGKDLGTFFYCTTYAISYLVLYMSFPPVRLLDLLAGSFYIQYFILWH